MNLLLGTFSSEKLEYISRCSVALKNVNLEQPKNSCSFSFKLIPKVTTPPPPPKLHLGHSNVLKVVFPSASIVRPVKMPQNTKTNTSSVIIFQ